MSEKKKGMKTTDADVLNKVYKFISTLLELLRLYMHGVRSA